MTDISAVANLWDAGIANTSRRLGLDVNKLDFSKGNGLVTVVTQDAITGSVLMIAHADSEAMEHTVRTGVMHYHSRSRGLWRKGATSGNEQRVVALIADCDGDAVLALVVRAGPACHNGNVSCFGYAAGSCDAFGALDRTIAERHDSAEPPADSTSTEPSALKSRNGSRETYTQRLLSDRNLRLKKLGEEAAEFIMAAADADSIRATNEAADLIYHVAVALHSMGHTLHDVRSVLFERNKQNRACILTEESSTAPSHADSCV